ncbi:hypothetical protein MPL1_05984 [Methylophaga lonarensis MPL]|uniref:Uncharacterized protein n=1 Tax=Methylophaga lonarensis MPL TaxID=1286106 RepID=M7PSB4_9GAMM|nr:hypothetical protein [Methylophaga lonarensis]EMR13299.1 hypothetical protein MPL1_05984 [Methylophaga lonarensis MPL]
MRTNTDMADFETWIRHHSEDNIFEYNGEIIDSEKAFRASGLHSQAKPSYQDWLASIS